MKKCLICFEFIPDDATVCPFCKSPQSVRRQDEHIEQPSSLKYARQPRNTNSTPQAASAPQAAGAPYSAETPYGASGQAAPPRKSNSILYFIIGVLVTTLLFLAGLLYYNSTQKASEADEGKSQPTATTSEAGEEATTPAPEPTPDYDRSEAQPVVAPAPRVVTTEGYHHLSGSISKYGITMDIEVTRNYVQGTYYYHSKGRNAKMTVYGTLEGNEMSLEEYAPDGTNTGRFDGTFDGLRYQGSFLNYNNGNYLSFNVVEQ